MIKWDKLVKRYVWDDDKTPYLVRVEALSRTQAQNELFIFSLFMCILFAVYTILKTAAFVDGGGIVLGIFAAYCFSMAAAGVILGVTRHWVAALYSLSAPVAMLLYFAFIDEKREFVGGHRMLVLVFVSLWLIYTVRVVAIARAFPGLQNRAPTSD